MKVEVRDILSVTPYPGNPRKNDGAVDKVAASLQEFGFRQPIVVDSEGVVIAGHTRLQAALRLSMSQVPVHVATELSEAQVAAYRLADNRTAEEAEWDQELLKIELGDLLLQDFDLKLTGFNSDELSDLLEDEDFTGLTDEDFVPEIPDDPTTEMGDVWILGNHRLLCGDSTSIDAVDKLMDGQKADMVFTDPPYGIDYSGGRTQVVATKTYGKIKNDNLIDEKLGGLIKNVWKNHKIDSDIYICVSPIMQKPFLDAIEKAGNRIDAVIVWNKKQPGLGYMPYRRQCEFIIFISNKVFHKGDKSDFDLWSVSKDPSRSYFHGTQKPVAIPERAIKNSSKREDLVMDLFLGSGSTLIACQKTNRLCYGMELDPKFCDVIIERWQAFTGLEATCEGENYARRQTKS